MSLPSFPTADPPIQREDAVNQILSSIAMEELGLSHILNAEGEKLQYILGTLPGLSGPAATVSDVLAANESVRGMLETAVQNQLFLKSKMQGALAASPMQGPTGPTGPIIYTQLRKPLKIQGKTKEVIPLYNIFKQEANEPPVFCAQKEALTMPEVILSDYFYGDESEEFVFFKIPRQLITNPKFKHVSTDAKLLYGMLLDRMSLSARNGWYDDTGRVYIYYSVDEICGDMTCGRDKAMKLLAELDTKKGIGLIERIKQGQGKPTKIYVKRFTTRTTPPKSAPPPPEPFAPISEVGFPDLQKSEIPTSRGRKNRLPEVEKPDPNHTKRNQTELIQPDPSISPRKPPAESLEMDRYERRKELKANIDYERLRREYPYDDIDDLLELMLDTVCSTAPAIRIGGSDIPTEAVRDRFLQLDSEHIQYVIDALKQTTTKINNIRAYLLTALYNAPVTIGPYYSAAVRHDFR